jgi:hypothetical protein
MDSVRGAGVERALVRGHVRSPLGQEQFQCFRGLVAGIRGVAGVLGVPVEEVFDSGIEGARGGAGWSPGQETAKGGGQGTGAANAAKLRVRAGCQGRSRDCVG